MDFFFDDEPSDKADESLTRVFGDIKVMVERAFVSGKAGPGGGVIIHHVDSKFLAVGRGFGVNFRITRPEAALTGILSAAGNQVDRDGVLWAPRVLNDYETRGG